MKIPYIELLEYNTNLSLLDYFTQEFSTRTVNNKNIEVVSSFGDISNPYIVPALSLEILYRRNRSIGFGNIYGEEEVIVEEEEKVVEVEGTLMEYRIQFNVYSNTRGENLKWSSILDEALKNGENGIALNTYLDNGNIKQNSIGDINYDYAQDVRNNVMNPNIRTYDFHTIYELRCEALQKYKMFYDYMELGSIIGQLK